ncbi:RiPP maturation radical SAM C-methyltransferase [Desulfonatronum thiodismutans]|uniref:RiPP maturation radical SAM C-methyltransferase n=1 Tax=Desulfonatronum thiodismutans TaxID=159290 RepID=UPI0004ABE16B|nr:RiPP maturation radical SAM C-methyltransferase [Desulfonatronum thiodismutans]
MHKPDNRNTDSRPVVLVSAPWAMYNRPSIQLGALKAYLRRRFPDVPVRAEHLHLQAAAEVGYSAYQAVSERTWVAESVAAALLFPDQAPAIQRLFQRESRQNPVLRAAGLPALAQALDRACVRFIADIDWSVFGLAGFSVSLCQLTCSLVLIRRIKRKYPELPVVVGGASFSGESLAALTAAFPEIDHLVLGEGETALGELTDALCRGGKFLPDASNRQIQDLDELPAPDFDDYFAQLQRLGPAKRFHPVLPVEASRGCWWIRKPRPDRPAQGCAFCNLNRHWTGYRSKSPRKVAEEITALSTRHKVLGFSFMDNLLPRKSATELFTALVESGRDYRLFGEIRADTPPAQLAAMRRAGMREVQVGVEALSSALLARMNKGTGALDNIEVMRHCEALGIHHGGNLLMRFPGSTAEEVEETLTNMDFAAPYLPLNPVSFWLGLESPVFRDPRGHKIRLTGNDPRWSVLFPPKIARTLRFMVQGYVGGKREQRRLWRPVEHRASQWAKEYAQSMRGPNPAPILGYQDGADFLIITRRRPDKTLDTHRLPQASRRIYLFCRKSRTRNQIQSQFPNLAADKLDGFLLMMVDKRLMFSESERFLSLAVPMDRCAEDFERPMA